MQSFAKFYAMAAMTVMPVTCAFGQEPLPDLVLVRQNMKPFTQMRSFAGGCEVEEGCITAGTHRLLRFNIETRNQGEGDLVLGAPEDNPLFHYAACHGHYHFENYCVARLLDTNGTPVTATYKTGFCLLDSFAWDAEAPPNAQYTCDNQGLQRGWADIYAANLACQYIDITGLPGGNYLLEMEVDPDNKLPESNDQNNVVRIPVYFDGPCAQPVTNDSFVDATAIQGARAILYGSSECASSEAGEAPTAGSMGRSVWYRWTAPFSGMVRISTDGSTFDTVLGVYRGTKINALEIVGENDDGGFGRNSMITFEAAAGDAYSIKVDGYQGRGGDYVLNVLPSMNDNFATSFRLEGKVGSIRDYNFNTGREPDEPAHAGYRAQRSLWYSWTSPFTGPAVIDTAGSILNTVLAVYTGGTLGALAPVASNDDQSPFTTSRVTFSAISNTTYHVAVDGRYGQLGLVFLRWGPPLRLEVGAVERHRQVTIHGATTDFYEIEVSSNLADWTVWQRMRNTNGVLHIEDRTSGLSQRFYRLLLE